MKILPVPQSFTVGDQSIHLKDFRVELDSSCDYRIARIVGKLKAENPFLSDSNQHAISVSVIGNSGEGYEIVATEGNIQVKGHSIAGAFYGVQTLRQIFSQADDGVISIYAIKDYGHKIDPNRV